MPENMIRIEVERIVNLVAGFGWSKVEEKIVEGAVFLTLRKLVPDMPAAMIGIEVERVVNLVAGFGWAKAVEKVDEGVILLTLRKTVSVTEEAS